MHLDPQLRVVEPSGAEPFEIAQELEEAHLVGLDVPCLEIVRRAQAAVQHGVPVRRATGGGVVNGHGVQYP